MHEIYRLKAIIFTQTAVGLIRFKVPLNWRNNCFHWGDVLKFKACGVLTLSNLTCVIALKQELAPDVFPDRSEVKNFDAKNLKHVETVEKNPIPSKDSKSFIDFVFARCFEHTY